ncbi:MAG: LysR family transcriptional regulator [Litoreibacter sp.]
MRSLDWTLIQAFLAVAEHGSLSAAARASGVSQPTLGRQIKAIESQMNVCLFDRQPKGLVLSETGQDLLPSAQAMFAAAGQFANVAAGRDSQAEGTVRITASEFVSHFILPKIFAKMRREHPDIQLELSPTDNTDNLLFREADIALRMYRPTQLDMITRKLGVLELGFFASKSYLDRRGRPEDVCALMKHDLIGYDRSERFIKGAASFGWDLSRRDFMVRCDLQTLHGELIAEGCGIGILSKVAAASMPQLEPIIPDFPTPGLGVWLTSHEAVRHTPRVHAVWKQLETGLARWLTNDASVPILSEKDC